jgi:HEAT repeat protein
MLDHLNDEPYTTVRAELARALGRSGNARAAAALQTLFRDETEHLVLTRAARALVDLGLGQPIAGNRRLRVPLRARELWVVARRGKAGQHQGR